MMEELFNLRHSQLRNVIEWTFEVLKRHFLFLQSALEYSYDIQVKLILVLTALYNFICKIRLEDIPNYEGEERELDRGLVGHSPHAVGEQHIEERDDENMAGIKDNIVESMWFDY